MALNPRTRSRRTTTEVTEPAVELATFPERAEKTVTEERREVELEDLLSEVGGDGRIRVWQIVDGKSAYAGEMSIVDFNLDLLMETYGGGDKSLVVYQGKIKRETFRVSLDPSIPPRNPRVPKVTGGQSSGSPGFGEISSVLAAMAQSQMAQSSAQSSAMAQSSQMMGQMMTAVVGAMATMMTARPEKDPLDIAVKIAELSRGNAAPGGDMAQMIDMMERGMRIGEKLGGKDDGDGVMGVVGEGMKTLGVLVDGIVTTKKLEAQRTQGAVPNAGTATVPVRELVLMKGASENPTTEEANVPAVRPWVDVSRPQIGLLLSAAKFMSPAAAAETVANSMADDVFFDLIDDIRDQTAPGFGARLLQYFPAASTVKPEWIGELVRVLLTEHVQDEADGAQGELLDTDTTTGDPVT